MARGKGLSLVVRPLPLWVRSDPVLLHGMLSNLVSNAIKYTVQGRVEVDVEVQGDQISLSVRDSGVGIREDKLETIFKEFVRLDALESGTEGLGLGLSIVKRYSLLLGHRLSVSSKLGQGSCFVIYLPMASAEAVGAHAQAGRPPDEMRLAGLSVLVVDNVDLLLTSMVKTLSAWGCRVLSARNLVEALVVSREQNIDLLISDFHLGDLEPNGLQLIEAVRARSKDFLPAILMTGDVSAQLETRATQQAVAVLHKPVRPNLLRERLVRRLDQAAVQQRSPQP